MQVIYKYVTLLSIVLFFITKSHSQSLPISSYGVWDRGAGVVDYSSPNTDFIKGIEISANWDEVQPTGPTSWDFSLFQQKLDLAVANDKLIRFSINVGPDCPSWLFSNGVPLVNVTIAPNSNQNYANRHPYYLNPVYKAYYFELIRRFALFLREQPQEKFDHIAFVQVKTGATGDEAPYKGTVNNPSYDISPADWQLFRLEAFAKFKLYFNDVPDHKIVLTFNNVDPTDEPEAYNYVMTVLDPVLGFGIKGGAYNRGHHLTDEQLYKEQWNPFLINPRVSTGNPNGRKLFSASEMDQSWTRGFFALNYEIGFYWSALGGINTGLSCTNISESAMTYALAHPEIIDIFKMYNRYAQQVYPATATTAFSIFHEGLNSADTVKFPESIYGNANKSNLTRYQNICNDSKYANRGARLDDPNFVTLGQVTQRENQNFYNDAGWEICEGNIERFMTQINPDATSIGLFRVRGTITSTSSKYDRFARSFENSTGKNTMYFQLHNEVQATNKNLKFTIIWLDKTAGSTWAFKYRNSAGLQTIPFTGTGTNQWRTEIFNVIDGVMNQGGVNGSDFMLVNTDTVDDIFNGIEMNIIGDGIQSQTINFNPFPYKKMGDADFNPGATASSGLAITYTSSNTNVATIVNNMIHIVGLGVSTITASQAGNNGYNPAPSIAQDLSVVIETSITTSTSGTWTCPADVNTIQVEVWGGGGGGGGTYLAGFAGGGAGGSYVINNSVTVVPAASYNLTVGAGGAQSGTGINGVNGNPGGNTTFGSATPVIANGGIAGGATTTAGQLGSGGTNSTGGSGGTVTLGLPGASGASGASGSGGAGAGAMGGAGGASKTSAGNGIEGTAPGGGGGGAYGPTTGSNRGSAGGAGQIIITYRVGAPNAPTIGTATVSGVNGQASISFTAPAFNGNSSITTYTATSSPGGITATVSQAGSGTMQVNGLTNGTVYTFTVRATNSIGQSVESAASNAVTPFTITAWDGAAWSNGTPTVSVDAIIAGNYSVAGNITAKTLTINNNAIVTIPSGYNVTVTGAVIVTAPATLTLSNNANLIQLNGITNTGAITVIKNSNALSRLDYTIWSSPVAEQNILAFSPATLSNRFYNYNETTNLFNVVASPSASPFATATGYLIRMPSDHPTTPTVWNGSFSGVPNNGTINKAITYNGSAPYGYNMIGNPYPSTIDADDFITINTSKIESSLYFWRKINSAPGSAYAVYNSLGATATPSSASPNGTIQVGQGFFVKAKSNSTISFTNAMRVANNDNQFFRTNQIQKDRIWLNLTNGSGVFSQTLIGYLEEGSQGEDSYDAKYINDSPIALTSNINNEEYTIQSRSTFDPADVVALNFKTTMTGDYTIAIDHFDGVFTTEQAIYLKDNTTGNETDLKAGSYTFAATAGIDNARFSLKYQRTLNVDAPEFNQNNVRVYINNGTLYVNSGTNVIKTIEVYDIQGRLIAQQKSVKATTATIHNLKATNQVLIVKIIDENSKVVIKKTVN